MTKTTIIAELALLLASLGTMIFLLPSSFAETGTKAQQNGTTDRQTARFALPSPSLDLSLSLSKTSSESISDVVARLDSGKIDKVYIYSAADVETHIAMTPDILSRNYSEKLEFTVNPQRKNQLISMLRSLKISQSDGQPETNIGVVLVDSAAKWQYTLFSDKFGKLGVLGGETVRINDSLIRFVQSLFAPIN